MFGLTFFLLISIVACAMDFGRAYTAKEQLQRAVDAASLAAARVWQTERDMTLALERGAKFFEDNKPAGINATLAVTSDQAQNSITLDAIGDVPAPFFSAANSIVRPLGADIDFSFLKVAAHAQAVLAVGGNSETNLEISLMLDTTGSMGGQKIADLKKAAKDLVDIVVWDDQGTYTSRVALAPFAPRINVGGYISQVTGLPPTSDSKRLTECVTERTGAAQFTDDAPAAGKVVGYAEPGHDTASQYSSSGNCNDTAEIMPLSNDKVALKARISSFTSGGSTAGALGTAWAWYMLSPKWNAIWPAASQPAAYNSEKLQKIAVLMTDGEYNHYQNAGADAATVSGFATTLCSGMKASGITVYTVGFALGGNPTAMATLQACASDSAKFYNAEDGDMLQLAFRDIALQIAKLRLTQ